MHTWIDGVRGTPDGLLFVAWLAKSWRLPSCNRCVAGVHPEFPAVWPSSSGGGSASATCSPALPSGRQRPADAARLSAVRMTAVVRFTDAGNGADS
jgi:hypothetical protein